MGKVTDSKKLRDQYIAGPGVPIVGGPVLPVPMVIAPMATNGD
jgi:hypothetical protein